MHYVYALADANDYHCKCPCEELRLNHELTMLDCFSSGANEMVYLGGRIRRPEPR
jgi:hypothetical protein